MYSFSYLEPVCCSMSSSNCCFLICIQISQEAGQVVWCSHFFKNFSVCCDLHSWRLWRSQWSRSRCFLGILLLFLWSNDVDNLISGSSAFSTSSLNIWKFFVHILLKPSLENFEHYFASMQDERNLCSSLNILWHCLSLELEWKLTFSSPVATAEFSKFAGILRAAFLKHHLLGFEVAQLEFHHLHWLCS